MFYLGLAALIIASLFATVRGFVEAPLIMVLAFITGCAMNVLFLKGIKWASVALRVVTCGLWLLATRWAIVPLLVSVPYILYYRNIGQQAIDAMRRCEEVPECSHAQK